MEVGLPNFSAMKCNVVDKQTVFKPSRLSPPVKIIIMTMSVLTEYATIK